MVASAIVTIIVSRFPRIQTAIGTRHGIVEGVVPIVVSTAASGEGYCARLHTEIPIYTEYIIVPFGIVRNSKFISFELHILEVVRAIVLPFVYQSVDDTFAVRSICPLVACGVVVYIVPHLPNSHIKKIVGQRSQNSQSQTSFSLILVQKFIIKIEFFCEICVGIKEGIE